MHDIKENMNIEQREEDFNNSPLWVQSLIKRLGVELDQVELLRLIPNKGSDIIEFRDKILSKMRLQGRLEVLGYKITDDDLLILVKGASAPS